ncbi:MAG: PD40 domain-containing protein [Lewinellaceae bacterium]|nr:PD40 domain-containing protein [Lewinellaceae bacterium]
MSRILIPLLLLLTTALTSLHAQDAPLWMRYPAISPDGTAIVFSYKGDLYRVPAEGGLAYPLTLHEAYDHMPVWSPDGKQIAFASDRFGNFDVFLMPAEGGPAKRLTYHSAGDYPSGFTADGQSILFTSSRLDIASNVQFPSGVLPELYLIPVDGGMPKQALPVPALDTRMSSDGNLLVYHDRKGYEDEFRKHHTSSVTRDVWLYDIKADSYKQLTDFEGEDRNPVFAPGEKDIYYLSEEGGDFNVFRMPLDAPANRKQLTHFEKNPVRYLTVSNDGTLCFHFNGEIYTMKEGQEPQKVAVKIATGDRYNDAQTVKVNSDISEMALSPNGKEMAFIHRGEVFVASVAEGTTRRITNTPEQERSVSFSPDGRSLAYAGERDGSWNVYQASIHRDEEPYFFNATLIDEKPVVNSPAEEFQPAYSPDGKEMAYLEERTTLKVINLESKETRTILSGDKNYSYSDGDQYYEWSPDGKWFLVEFLQPKQWLSQAGLVSAEGGKEPVNLTKSGYGAGRPKWMMDGQMMLWFSDRDGMQNHSGRGSEADAYAMFFTQEAYDKFTMDEEEYKLMKEKEKEAKKEESKEEEKKEEEKEIKPVKIELDGIEDRKARLTIHSSRMADAYVTKDGEKLFYLTKFEKGYDIWQTDLRTKETKKLTKLDSKSPSEFIVDKEEKNIFVLADGQIKKVEIESAEAKPIGINGEMVLQEPSERAYLFEHVWRQVEKKFYKVSLHDVEWEYYKKAYARFLPHINNDHDFADMLSEMLGELNASHTGARYRPENEEGDETAALGLFYDYDYEGNGLKITEVMDKSPVVKEDSKIKAGVVIEKIDGQAITPQTNPYQLLNRKADKNTLLSLYDPAGKERWEEVVKPISLREESELRYQRWVENCRKAVEELSGGRIGYVHVRGMNDDSYRTVYEEVLGRHANKEALIVDTRFNGGGWLHDNLATFLSGQKYVTMMPRGQDLGSEPMSKWYKPSVVLMSESNYSDAHMFPYAYKALGIGKLIGMPVPGTATAVWWERLHTGDLIFGIPQVGVVTNDGEYLENNQLEPDIKVPNEPGVVSKGEDQQLEAAVKELLRQLEQARP